MAIPVFCGSELRRDAVRGRNDLNGIDFLEVSDDQLTLTVQFLNPLPGEPSGVPAGPHLHVDNVRIEGGVRITNIAATSVSSNGERLTVTVSAPGDFSNYRFRLSTSAVDRTSPPGFDPRLSEVEFNFKVGCPTDFDCKDSSACPDDDLDEIEINYLAKDYATFRRLMLDTMARTRPDWREPNPADLEATVVEALAFVADRLSYYQDAVATEAYLGTARLRTSVRRHARLLDYFVSEGCNARTWICFEVAAGQDGAILETGTPILAAGITAPPTLAIAEFAKLGSESTVFELMHSLTLRESRNTIDIFTWSDEECCLPVGATSCTLVNDPDLQLTKGDLVLFEEIRNPDSGDDLNAIRDHRHVVRLTDVAASIDPVSGTPVVDVTWHDQDALPFPLRISGRYPATGGLLVQVAVARANVALADHGRRVDAASLDPAEVPQNETYRPRLDQVNLTFAVPFDAVAMRELPAVASLASQARDARPVLSLVNEQGTWQPQRDLLSSDRFALDFVAEVSDDLSVHLRFGDDVLGARPRENTEFQASLRYGAGPEGNVGPGSLTCLIANQPLVTRVWNPLPGIGGEAPEPIENVKRDAPQAFRTQLRAVTEQDWADRALGFSYLGRAEIQRAVAEFRWTGSWYTVFLTVDRRGGASVSGDPQFRSDLLAYLEQFRVAGYDLELRDPIYVPIDLRLFICVKDGYFRSDVQARVRETLASSGSGFFNPDRFTFGQSVYLSQIVAAVDLVDGVDSVEVQVFQRWGKSAAGEIAKGFLAIGAREVARLDNDPNFAENGVLQISLGGGL